MAGPGYGRTLGEVLVSEGLSGQFTRQLFANPSPSNNAYSVADPRWVSSAK